MGDETAATGWLGPHLERVQERGVSADWCAMLLARMPAKAHERWLVANGTARKEACPTVQSLPESAASAAPLGPVAFGGFFYAPCDVSNTVISATPRRQKYRDVSTAGGNWQAVTQSSKMAAYGIRIQQLSDYVAHGTQSR